MSPQTKTLVHRLRMLKQIKGWVRGYLGPEPSTLKTYALPYKKEFTGRWRPSETDELFDELKKAEIVYGGDFHGFAQAQRTHLRVLRSLSSRKKVILALEVFETRHQRLLNHFLAGKMGETEFLSKIHWEKNWGFPWEHYRPLLELARRRGWQVVALNRHITRKSAETLKTRDRHAAKQLVSVLLRNPGSITYVVFGDLHIAGAHLPKWVDRDLGRPARSVFLFQNSERLYFTLARKGQEAAVHLLRRGNRFCVLSSPPWVKWQSYLMFLENSLDRDLLEEIGEIDLTAYIRQS
ncbi:MAG: ChaN family lipoprotein, partial [Bdellovibrionia bacterium]